MRVIGPSILAVIPRSTSVDLSFENNTFMVKVSYISDSTMARTFRPKPYDPASVRA
jgi:hypothetical protein